MNDDVTVMIDGALVPPERATISVFDRGLLYGDGLFETVRTYAGRPFALDDHLARLARGAAAIRLHLPVPLATIAAEVHAAIAASARDDAAVRILVTRGVALGGLGLDLALAPVATRIVLVAPLRLPSRALYTDGARAVTIAAPAPAAPGAKTLAYLPNLLAADEARARGAHEALFVDAAECIIEGATSNVFAIRGDTLITPPDDAALLAGITRAHILDLAGAAGLTAVCAPLPRHALLAADEAFLTSSLREVLPLVTLDAHAVGAGVPGPRTRALHLALRARAGAVAPPPWEPGAAVAQ